MNETTTELSPGVYTLFAIIIILVALAAIFFLYLGIRRERNRYIVEKLKLDEMDKSKFDNMLERRLRSANKKTNFSVMFIELLNGAALNDSFGDRLFGSILEKLYERIHTVVPKGAKVGMYSPNLLAVYIDEDLDEKGLNDVTTFCYNECVKPITLVTRVTVSAELAIGSALYNGEKIDAARFRENVESALLAAKKSGVGGYAVYKPEIDYSEDESYQYYREMQTAIHTKEFVLYYQPIFDTSSRSVFAFESLLRWNHSEQGLLSAQKFVPILEQSGDLYRVGLYSFEILCQAIQRYRQNNPEETPTLFSFNTSKRQLLKPNLADDLYRIAKKYRINTSEVCIEVPEFKIASIVANIRKLAEYGFKLAIDGLNVESGSLDGLNDLPLEWIKLSSLLIEQAEQNFFLRGAVETIIRFAQSKGIKVVAYNVDNEESASGVKNFNITCAQGNFFASPRANVEQEV